MQSFLPDSRFWVPRIVIFQCQLVRGLAKFRLSEAGLGVKMDESGFFFQLSTITLVELLSHSLLICSQSWQPQTVQEFNQIEVWIFFCVAAFSLGAVIYHHSTEYKRLSCSICQQYLSRRNFRTRNSLKFKSQTNWTKPFAELNLNFSFNSAEIVIQTSI